LMMLFGRQTTIANWSRNFHRPKVLLIRRLSSTQHTSPRQPLRHDAIITVTQILKDLWTKYLHSVTFICWVCAESHTQHFYNLMIMLNMNE